MDFSLAAIAAVVAATAAGSMVQGSVGFGMNLVSVPVFAVVLPRALPVTVIVLGLPISIGMLHHERHAVDRAGVAWMVGGRVPGTILGAGIVATVSTSGLQRLAGVIVLALVLASLATPPVPVRRNTQVAAGLLSGLTGTAAGIGGPPLALLYQHHEAPTMRSTLAGAFLIGTVMSLTVLAIAGTVGVDQIILGICLTPVVVAGSIAGRRLHNVLDRGWMRPAVLAFAAATAILALAGGI